MVPPARAADAAEGPAAMVADAAVLGRLVIPGRGEQVRVARAFVARVLRELAGRHDTVVHNAVLLTSELVTNAICHSGSGEPGGSVMLVLRRAAGGIRVEVTDSGSADGAPVVQDDVEACGGRGLFLVDAVADEWGYQGAAQAGTTVWFRLGPGTG
jgi:anti-sigma regulatory factor (Ser/Thr protein kinase)